MLGRILFPHITSHIILLDAIASTTAILRNGSNVVKKIRRFPYLISPFSLVALPLPPRPSLYLVSLPSRSLMMLSKLTAK